MNTFIRYRRLVVSIALVLSCPKISLATCAERTHGSIVIQVEKCSVVDPNAKFAAKGSLPSWVADMDSAGIARFIGTYRGILITGSVKKSSAVRSGLLNINQALKGDVITVFSPGRPSGCAGLASIQVQGHLEEQCCDGGGVAPCLLSQKYILNELTVSLPVAQDKIKFSEDYKKGREFFHVGKFRKAIPLLKRAYDGDKLDLSGKWILSSALEHVDDCVGAIVPLGDIKKTWVRGETSSVEDKLIGPAMLLLARCLSRVSKAAAAVDVLNLLLERPKIFRNEIEIATRHRDFSWIRSTSVYRNFLTNVKMRGSAP